MTRFSTPEEVLQAAEKAAADDLARHLPARHDEDGTPYQIDLNPYCTVGGRDEWARGFHNTPPRSWEEKHRTFNFQFQRGAAARRLLDAHNAKPKE